jgi:hypothetical protein
MNTASRFIGATIIAGLMTLIAAGCDNRSSFDPNKPQPSFSADISVVKEYLRRQSNAEITFLRDGDPMPDGVVRLNDLVIPQGNGGRYSLTGSLTNILRGNNTVTFINDDDNYTRTIAIDMPDSFVITEINPNPFSGGQDVAVQWIEPTNATKVLLVVKAQDYPDNGTIPFMTVLNADETLFYVPDTTFMDSNYFLVPDSYYIYLAAFNQGFGEYDGIPFPLPPGLPQRRILDPVGFARYGTIAPIDSVIVLP